MDLRKLKTLIDLVSESNVSELEITEAEGKVRIVKGGGAVVQQVVAAPVLAQPAVAMAFAPALAGRALSAYNLVVFAGVFVLQWGIGLGVDLFSSLGLSAVDAFRVAMGVFLALSVLSYAYFLALKSHNARQPISP